MVQALFGHRSLDGVVPVGDDDDRLDLDDLDVHALLGQPLRKALPFLNLAIVKKQHSSQVHMHVIVMYFV